MLQGSIVALVTPMTASGDVDYPAIQRLVKDHLQAKTDGLVILGSTGEAATLTANERAKIIETVVREVSGQIPVIVGTGNYATQKTLEQTVEAAKLGADMALVVGPYYVKPTQAGLIAHYEALQAANIPIILYNHPGRTGVDIQPETVQKLAKLPHIIGIKESSSLERAKQLIEICPKDFIVLSGDDENALGTIKAGGKGLISVAANVYPQHMKHMIQSALDNESERAEALHKQLTPFFHAMSLETNPIPVKWAMHASNKIDTGIRLPLQPLAVQYRDELTGVMETVEADIHAG